MFSRRAASTLSKAERQALRRQWLQPGRCTRCFSASVRSHAEQDGAAEGNDQGTPYNTPKRGPTRQERSAMISEEVKMIHRDHPAPSFAEPDPNTQRPPGASETVDPQALGQNVGPGRMGENAQVGQEGPAATNVGSTPRSDADIMDRSVTPSLQSDPRPLENPAEAKDEVVESSSGVGPAAKTRPAEGEEDEEVDVGEEETDDQDETWSKAAVPEMSKADIAARDELLHNGGNMSTIAAGNYEGVIEDRMRILAEPGQQEGYRHAPYLAWKMMHGQMVRFESKKEQAAVETEAKKIAEGWAARYAERKKIGKGDVQPAPLDHTFTALPQTVRQSIMEKLVAGKYDPDGLFEGKEKHKQPVLNDIAKMTMRNGTYMKDDGDRLLKKVRSLLPAVQTQRTKPAAKAE